MANDSDASFCARRGALYGVGRRTCLAGDAERSACIGVEGKIRAKDGGGGRSVRADELEADAGGGEEAARSMGLVKLPASPRVDGLGRRDEDALSSGATSAECVGVEEIEVEGAGEREGAVAAGMSSAPDELSVCSKSHLDGRRGAVQFCL